MCLNELWLFRNVRNMLLKNGVRGHLISITKFLNYLSKSLPLFNQANIDMKTEKD